VRLYRVAEGWAREESGELAVLDIGAHDTFPDVTEAATALVRSRLPLDETPLLAPVRTNGSIILVGANYRSHIQEAGLRPPTRVAGLPLTATTATGPDSMIVLPAEAPGQVDYEGEVAVVIGADAQSIPSGRGWDSVAGICAANDVSARDVQLSGMRDGAVVDLAAIKRGKGFPTFKPMGPCLVTADEVRDVSSLSLRTWVNGELRQEATTAELLFALDEVVEGVSARVHLHPGDVILTGTPAGVGLSTGRYLTIGDVVEVEVQQVGRIRNPCR